MDGRKSLTLAGAADEDLLALRDHDTSFYGLDSDLELSSDDSDSDAEPAEKIPLLAETEASSGDEIFDSGDELLLGSQDSEDVTAREGYIAAQLRDSVKHGCKCKTNHWKILPGEKVQAFMVALKDLRKQELKQLVLEELHAFGKETKRSKGASASASAASNTRSFYYSFTVLGTPVCREVFSEVHGLSHHVLRTLQETVERLEVLPPVHRHTGRIAPNALPAAVTDNVLAFIRNYASRYGIPQPAAPRGRAKAAPTYLPASDTKKKVFKLYSETEGATPIGLSSFQSLWTELVPDVIIMKRRSDVCVYCERLREDVRFAKTEEATRLAMDNLQQHLQLADDERQCYKSAIADATASFEQDGDAAREVHLTFDFAQQLEVPHHTRQVGPIYFKSRFKIQLFGVCNEAQNKQVNFLFHEGECIGEDGKRAHGPNSVLSTLHKYLSDYPPETILKMHADNCVGQNKNRSVIAYLSWRVLTGLSNEIELSFMRVGHTRCSVDAKFGRLKQSFRGMEVDTMADVIKAVSSSCDANIPLRFDWEWREWDKFLAVHFIAVKNIRQYQHFRVEKDKPGVVTMKKACTDSDEEQLTILKQASSIAAVADSGLPPVIQPGGIGANRLQYLDKEIKPHLTRDSLPPWCEETELD